MQASENSLGMRLVEIPSGTFRMGATDGRESDERPVHDVRLTQPFQLSECPVTNAQYEQFDPEHRQRRGHRGVSQHDDEAVVCVSWHEAVAFCEWLSEREGCPYRLPTEAEWEYACRAGTTTAYWTGDELPEPFHRNQFVEGDWETEKVRADDDLREKKGVVPVDLSVGQTPANPWGVRDVHGVVEEWCHDWHGPYPDCPETDPIGPQDGLTRVTRGGSHSTYAVYLRSVDRHAALPEDRHWLIGFRVVRGTWPAGEARPVVPLSLDDDTVDTAPCSWSAPNEEPIFQDPIAFVRPDGRDPENAWLHHHHNPSIAWCPNGDLLAVWFNTRSEVGREMRVLASRLRCGADSWDTARVFFNVADRNTTGPNVFHDGTGTLYFFDGVSESSHHRDQCLVMARSLDSGRTWKRPRIISSLTRRQKYTPMPSIFSAADGTLVLPLDCAPLGSKAAEQGGTGVFLSRDGGETWEDRVSGKRKAEIVAGGQGGLIAGFHAPIVQRADGSLLAFGRTHPPSGMVDIEGRMPQSVSHDMGRSWSYEASPFPPIGGGQKAAMCRLQEGPILLVSFTDRDRSSPAGMRLTGAAGTPITGTGLFAAVSFDEGENWPHRRLLTTGGPAREMDGGGNTGRFVMDDTHAEPRGYLAVTQSPDGVIHLLSSRYHYRFNLPWLVQFGTVRESSS